MAMVRISDTAKCLLDDLVKAANENKQQHEPKYTQEVYLNKLINDIWEDKARKDEL